MQIEFDNALPIYEQIIDYVKKSIARGELQSGDKLPSQREMAHRLEVNPNTIQRAYREMESLGLVETKRGKGTFIVDSVKVIEKINEDMASEAISYFVNEMKSLGFSNGEIMNMLKSELEIQKV